MMSNNSVKKATIEASITQAIKARIRDLGLVDTGEMLNSISCQLIFNDAGFKVDVNSTDYFSILDAKYDIVDFVLNENQIYTEIIDLFADLVLQKL